MKRTVTLLGVAVCMAAGRALAREGADELVGLQYNINVVWTLVAAILVFFMQAGFAMVETGFTRAKNAVNILMKNLMDFSIGSLAFFLVGFGLMFGAAHGGLFGTSYFGMSGITGSADGAEWGYTFVIFQTVFAATAATIVSGAMAERTRFNGYLVYSLVICLFIYPVFGKWAWGSLFAADGAGWLENLETGARTGTIGDGKIFVLDLPDCIRIRTGETGAEAIG